MYLNLKFILKFYEIGPWSDADPAFTLEVFYTTKL